MPTTPGSTSFPWLDLAPGIGAGTPLPAGWQPIAERPLLILVGVTGVGKSTALEHLAASRVRFSALPDRRTLTDTLIIAAMQAASGAPVVPVRDRAQRFEYTRRFRARFAGGMAHALALLAVDPAQTPDLLLFDGLRGENEIEAACAALPQACFVLLDAPDAVRVVRLLGRGDAFDQIAAPAPAPTPAQPAATSFHDLGLDDAAALFTPAEQALLLQLAARGTVSADDLRAKVRIVAEERRGYDPAATRRALARCAGERALLIDTTRHDPAAVAALIAARIQEWFPD